MPIPIVVVLRRLLVPIVAAAAATAQASVPTGFVDEQVYVGGLVLPAALARLPDGRLLVGENDTGAVKLIDGGAAATVYVVPGVDGTNDRGLTGIAVDPLWPAWPYLYFHYTHVSGTVRVLRATAVGGWTPSAAGPPGCADPYVVLEAPDAHPWHNGGTLRFAPDGLLFASLGDDFDDCTAQDVESLCGAIVRLDVAPLRGFSGPGFPPHATIAAPGNPFAGPNGQLVYAFGLRNPFRFDVDPATGALYVADVGHASWEELTELVAGGDNCGWPYFEGFAPFGVCPSPAPVAPRQPVYSYPHGTGPNAAFSFGGRYRASPAAPYGFGPNYDGDVFVVDGVQGFVRRLKLGAGGWAPAPPVPGQPNATDWATGCGGAVDAFVAPDGALYYLRIYGPGQVRRIRSVGATLTKLSGDLQAGNSGRPLAQPFVVRLTAHDGAPVAGAPVTFSLSAGGGALLPSAATTDATGLAASTLLLDVVDATDPAVVAASPAAPSAATFAVDWRGLVGSVDLGAGVMSLEFHHSATSSPLTIVFDAPATSPFFVFDFGDIWTNVLGPGAPWAFIDGLGLLGPPDPTAATPANGTVRSYVATNVPTVPGFSALAQGYALDLARWPDFSSIVVTAPLVLSFY
jgi:glucose/arabinose dehydrogenase